MMLKNKGYKDIEGSVSDSAGTEPPISLNSYKCNLNPTAKEAHSAERNEVR
jgi:hypothetical protein